MSSFTNQYRYAALALAAASSVLATSPARASTPYLPAPQYGAVVNTTGAAGDVSIYQDVPAGNHPYNNHYSMNNPAAWTLDNSSSFYAAGIRYELRNQASATTSDQHNGTVSVSALTDNNAASAEGWIRYYFMVIGPDAASVAVTISGYGSAEASALSGLADAHASFQVNYFDPISKSKTSRTDTIANHQHFTFSETINVAPNADYFNNAPSVLLYAAVSVGSNLCLPRPSLPCQGAGSAYIDPVFTIADPKLASLYKVVGFDGRVLSTPPVSSVPEPATWAGLLAGFALIGTRMRLRRGGRGSRPDAARAA